MTHAAVWVAVVLTSLCARPAAANLTATPLPPTPTPAPLPPTVDVPGLGSLRGAWSAHAGRPTAVFRGIPYAQPPVGPRRWQPPSEAVSWDSPRDAAQFGKACIGADMVLPSGVEVAEDCLYLNVQTPAAALNPSAAVLPVAVWIHGGEYSVLDFRGFFTADSLVAGAPAPLVVVTMNYRLNAFGFLGGRELCNYASDHTCGNYGIADQRAVLTWISRYIHAFGGDSGQVTIFGLGAGGNSVLTHLSSPLSYPLYGKAVVQSGTYHAAIPMAKAEATYQALLVNLGCANLSCLLALPAETIFGALNSTFGPVIDGVSRTADPMDLIRLGEFNHAVPVVVGSCRDDSFDCLSWPSNMTEEQLDELLVTLGDEALPLHHTQQSTCAVPQAVVAKVKQLYAFGDYPYPADLGNLSKWWWMGERIFTDAFVGHCSARRVARWVAASNPERAAYVYMFAHPPEHELPIPPGIVVAFHGSEVPYVFDHVSETPDEGGERELAVAVSSYWTHFFLSGAPNGAGLPVEWPKAHTPGTLDFSLRLDVTAEGGVQVEQGLRNAACNFWDDYHHHPTTSPTLPPPSATPTRTSGGGLAAWKVAVLVVGGCLALLGAAAVAVVYFWWLPLRRRGRLEMTPLEEGINYQQREDDVTCEM